MNYNDLTGHEAENVVITYNVQNSFSFTVPMDFNKRTLQFDFDLI